MRMVEGEEISVVQGIQTLPGHIPGYHLTLLLSASFQDTGQCRADQYNVTTCLVLNSAPPSTQHSLETTLSHHQIFASHNFH